MFALDFSFFKYNTLNKFIMFKLSTKLPVFVGRLYNFFRQGVTPLVANPSSANFDIRQNLTIYMMVFIVRKAVNPLGYNTKHTKYI